MHDESVFLPIWKCLGIVDKLSYVSQIDEIYSQNRDTMEKESYDSCVREMNEWKRKMETSLKFERTFEAGRDLRDPFRVELHSIQHKYDLASIGDIDNELKMKLKKKWSKLYQDLMAKPM